MNEQQLLKEQALNVLEIIEDSVESICDEHVISGEKVWTMIYALAEVKLNDFPQLEEEDDDY
mgnify:CR=1 FL=1|tara:strand:- start:123 stop:308 length:186 start_codon:yes stop_codon:yes gene_type:complete